MEARNCVLVWAMGVIVSSAPVLAGDWKAKVLLETERGMGGAAIGDLEPVSPGNEVVVVNSANEVWMARRDGEQWSGERIYQGEGEFIMCAIGDVDPRYPGNEFVGVGMVQGEESLTGPGQVVMIRREGDKWLASQLFEDDHMLHGVAVGDVSSRTAGNEIIACGFNHRVTLLSFDGERWRSEVVYVGNDRMKIAAIADVLPDHPGNEVVVAGMDGNSVVLWEDRLGWKHEIINTIRAGQSRVACGASGVLIGGDNGSLTFAQRTDGRWAAECIARDSAKIRGVAIADVDSGVPGVELYACGYSRNVTQLVRDDNGYWSSRVIYTDAKPLHHLVAGEIDPAHEGPELVTCGHGGRLTVLTPSD